MVSKNCFMIEGTSYPLNARGIGLAVYTFDKALNRSIYGIGFCFEAISHNLRKFLHTGYWNRYALIIFFSIILLIVGMFVQSGHLAFH
ncbi:MAG: hypothetical protein AB1847_09130 [bacterium]